MKKRLAFAMLAITTALVDRAEAQMVVSGGLRSSAGSSLPVRPEETAVKIRRLRRERNPYFVARPTYPTANQGARANVTFEPFTRWYYPNENSYYPPLTNFPSIRSR